MVKRPNAIEINVDPTREPQIEVFKPDADVPDIENMPKNEVRELAYEDVETMCLGLAAIIRSVEDGKIERKGKLMAYAMKRLEEEYIEPNYRATHTSAE